MENAEKVIVAGHGIYTDKESGKERVYVIFKDKVSKNVLFQTKCSKTGTMFLLNGVTLDEAKEMLPVGHKETTLAWGEEVPDTLYGGIYKLTEL